MIPRLTATRRYRATPTAAAAAGTSSSAFHSFCARRGRSSSSSAGRRFAAARGCRTRAACPSSCSCTASPPTARACGACGARSITAGAPHARRTSAACFARSSATPSCWRPASERVDGDAATVDIVCHSMGGIILRACLAARPDSREGAPRRVHRVAARRHARGAPRAVRRGAADAHGRAVAARAADAARAAARRAHRDVRRGTTPSCIRSRPRASKAMSTMLSLGHAELLVDKRVAELSVVAAVA